jgi:hypothetical protein
VHVLSDVCGNDFGMKVTKEGSSSGREQMKMMEDIREKEEEEVKERERQTKGRNEVRDEDMKEIFFFSERLNLRRC